MKKIIKVASVTTLLLAICFVNKTENIINTTKDFSLDSLFLVANAQGEWGDDDYCSWCTPNEPYAEEPVPADFECPDYDNPVRVYNNEYDLYGHIEYLPIMLSGTECEDAMGPWGDCEPNYPC